MAYIDYGAIAFKNGKLISTDMFTPMKDMVGWEDTEEDYYCECYDGGFHNCPLKAKGNYFAYIGDEEYTVCFMKDYITMLEKLDGNRYCRTGESFSRPFYGWSKWEGYFGCTNIKVTPRNGYYVCKWKYKGDKYKVYFGYGVDLSYYKKWHMVNYYRSPKFLAHKAKCWINDKIDDFKWEHGW